MTGVHFFSYVFDVQTWPFADKRGEDKLRTTTAKKLATNKGSSGCQL